MPTPIYHLWIVHGFKEAYYQLTDAGRDDFWAKISDTTRSSRREYVVACNSRWNNESIRAWGLEFYQNLTDRQAATHSAEEQQQFRYMDSETILGTRIEGFPTTPVTFPNPLYQLTLIRRAQNLPWEDLAEAERQAFWGRMVESINTHGGAVMAACDTDWSCGEYSAFGVTAWPNVEALQAHTAAMAAAGWHRWLYTRVLLGIAEG